MIKLAERLLTTNTPGTLATLFSVRGSTYRPLGSMMVSLPGLHAGGISGGCLEEYVARAGERATRDAPAAVLSFSTYPDSDDDIPVLGCGGAIDVLVERLTPTHLGWLRRFSSACEADEPSLAACVVTRSDRGLVAQRTWLLGAHEEIVAARAMRALCAETLQKGRSHYLALGNGRDLLLQYVPPLTRLVIAGAGDDAQPLCELGSALGWHVTVIDRRARLATTARFPHANTVLAADWDEALRPVVFTPHTAAVLMTHSLHDDARALSQLSTKDCAYIGVLGPSQRLRWLIEEVSVQGTTLTTSCLARLRGPIGLDLGDRSPAGIAVAITAEILASMNRRRGQPLGEAGTVAGRAAQRTSHA
jgi:xanthine/CO dehydrogenase XdhC/CoxF family maturation factor